ncbi:MAG: hypothetical protein AAGA61_08115 [Pseudomonadota bacterium]
MKRRAHIFGVLQALVLACVLAAPAAAEGEDEAVIEVTVVKIYGSTDEYLSKVGAILDVIRKHEPRAEPRVYQSAFSGTDYGRIHISTRYPSFAALAAANPKIVNDPDHHKAIEALAAVDREIISHYMLRDKTPN